MEGGDDGVHYLENVSSFFDDRFAELLARQEEFHGIKLLKKLLQASVVEYERRRAAAGPPTSKVWKSRMRKV
jgi:hypothetical protein